MCASGSCAWFGGWAAENARTDPHQHACNMSSSSPILDLVVYRYGFFRSRLFLQPCVGALWGGLLPTVIAIAVYFCLADAVLMAQTVYYNRIAAEEKSGARRRSSVFSNDPSQPLIAARDRRRSSAASRRSSRRDSLSAAILDDDENSYSPVVRNALSLLGVVAAGALGWAFAWWTGAWKAQQGGTSAGMPLGAAVLGYISAVLYLTARIPQIIRNHQKKSCEGLSSPGRSVS